MKKDLTTKNHNGIAFDLYQNQEGMTLIELMISAALSLFVTLVAVIFLQSIAVLNLRGQKSDNIQTDLDRFILTLQNYTFYAVNVRYFGTGSLDGVGTSTDGQGFVRGINIDQQSDLGGRRFTTLMFFARETAVSTLNPTALRSVFGHTAVFYRAKDEGVTPRVPPAILIHPGQAGALGPRDLSTNDNNFLIPFEYLSDIRLDQPIMSTENATNNLFILNSIRMTVKGVYPIASTATSGNNLTECFGPTRDIQNNVTCQNSLPYKVLQKAAVLYFPNNKRHTFNSKHEFVDGVYFFRPGLSF